MIILTGICIVILSIYMVWVLLCIIAIFLSIWKKIVIEKRKPKVKRIRKWIWQIISRLIVVSLIINIVVDTGKGLYTWGQMPPLSRKENGSVQQEYQAVLQGIPFANEVINRTETIWEHLISEELMYKNYVEWGEEYDDFDQLRNLYMSNNVDMAMWIHIDVDELVSHMESFYGTEILPVTDKTLEEVMEEIPPLNVRLYSDVNLYKNEFWLRGSKCGADSSAAWLNQTGRAADDVFKVLINSGAISLKQLIFFGAMAISFYLASVECDDGERDLPLIYYRIAEIFICLNKYSSLREDEAYSQHFYLMAENALILAKEEFNNAYGEGNIQGKLPYFNCYYAEILYKFNRMHWSESERLVKMCGEYAEACIAGDDLNGTEGYCVSCGDILARLSKKFH